MLHALTISTGTIIVIIERLKLNMKYYTIDAESNDFETETQEVSLKC